MLEIGNIYGHGLYDRHAARLQSLGFFIRPQISRFAGSQILRFVDLQEGPSLELIEVEEEEEYLAFLPKGMIPYCPGINLVLSENVATRLEDYQDKFSNWGPYRLYVNYDGSEDTGKPGWNYLNFEVPVVRGTFIWLTQREEPQPERDLVMDHPNKANCVAGLVFDLEKEELLNLSRLVGVEMVEGAFEINDVRIFSRYAFDCAKEITDKKFPLVAVVVKVESLKHIRALEGVVEQINCFSKPSLYIPLHELSWDLIITA